MKKIGCDCTLCNFSLSYWTFSIFIKWSHIVQTGLVITTLEWHITQCLVFIGKYEYLDSGSNLDSAFIVSCWPSVNWFSSSFCNIGHIFINLACSASAFPLSFRLLMLLVCVVFESWFCVTRMSKDRWTLKLRIYLAFFIWSRCLAFLSSQTAHESRTFEMFHLEMRSQSVECGPW